MNNPSQSGTLYIVATPIGNLDDISRRAIQTLESVDGILAEDTRHSQRLLNHLAIKKPMQSLHAHNEKDKSHVIISQLQAGKHLALISDAGTPLISDPGFPLVRLARAHNITVCPIPGACAFVAALSASGLHCDSFIFVGFLAHKAIARQKQLQSYAHDHRTTIFYEATHRIKAFILDILQVMGEERHIVLAKELTKTFETFVSGNANDVLEYLNAEPGHIKGEFVVIIEGCSKKPAQLEATQLIKTLLNYLPVKQAAKCAAELSDINKNDAYQLALSLKNN